MWLNICPSVSSVRNATLKFLSSLHIRRLNQLRNSEDYWQVYFSFTPLSYFVPGLEKFRYQLYGELN